MNINDTANENLPNVLPDTDGNINFSHDVIGDEEARSIIEILEEHARVVTCVNLLYKYITDEAALCITKYIEVSPHIARVNIGDIDRVEQAVRDQKKVRGIKNIMLILERSLLFLNEDKDSFRGSMLERNCLYGALRKNQHFTSIKLLHDKEVWKKEVWKEKDKIRQDIMYETLVVRRLYNPFQEFKKFIISDDESKLDFHLNKILGYINTSPEKLKTFISLIHDIHCVKHINWVCSTNYIWHPILFGESIISKTHRTVDGNLIITKEIQAQCDSFDHSLEEIEDIDLYWIISYVMMMARVNIVDKVNIIMEFDDDSWKLKSQNSTVECDMQQVEKYIISQYKQLVGDVLLPLTVGFYLKSVGKRAYDIEDGVPHPCIYLLLKKYGLEKLMFNFDFSMNTDEENKKRKRTVNCYTEHITIKGARKALALINGEKGAQEAQEALALINRESKLRLTGKSKVELITYIILNVAIGTTYIAFIDENDTGNLLIDCATSFFINAASCFSLLLVNLYVTKDPPKSDIVLGLDPESLKQLFELFILEEVMYAME